MFCMQLIVCFLTFMITQILLPMHLSISASGWIRTVDAISRYFGTLLISEKMNLKQPALSSYLLKQVLKFVNF